MGKIHIPCLCRALLLMHFFFICSLTFIEIKATLKAVTNRTSPNLKIVLNNLDMDNEFHLLNTV